MTQSAWDRERTRIALERCAKALALRDEGWKLKDIGKEMGVGVERARQLVMKGRRMVWFRSPEGVAARKLQQAKERAEKQAQKARDDRWKRERKAEQDRLKRRRGESRAAYDERILRTTPVYYDPDIVHQHALQQLWRQFIEPHGAWRRPLVGPYRPLHDWLDWRGSAGITYRNVPGQLLPEWRVSA